MSASKRVRENDRHVGPARLGTVQAPVNELSDVL